MAFEKPEIRRIVTAPAPSAPRPVPAEPKREEPARPA